MKPMTQLIQQFQEVMSNVNVEPRSKLASQDLFSLLDLTCLEDTTDDAIADLSVKAKKYETAAVCVYPEKLCAIDPTYKGKRATVVNFPTGDLDAIKVVKHIETIAQRCSVEEIDYVFPYQAYLEGAVSASLLHVKEVRDVCLEYQLNLKVIMETGCFASIQDIYEASQRLLDLGCPFLKTSTGKVPAGATNEAVFAISSAIASGGFSAGIKCSGGVRTAEIAERYILIAETVLKCKVDADWFRIGSSSLLGLA